MAPQAKVVPMLSTRAILMIQPIWSVYLPSSLLFAPARRSLLVAMLGCAKGGKMRGRSPNKETVPLRVSFFTNDEPALLGGTNSRIEANYD
jgi:hypothetical protein